MDVAVRRADAPEDSVLASVSGFYGKAIGAAGGGVQWDGTGAPGGSGGEGEGGDEAEPKPGKNPKPPPGLPTDNEE